ncbi:MAG: Gfo/Idh/MocA family oxidoreductase [Bryobacteraceae bacterium]|nr:Gfo/Idh/MocA family oxidoreductase [Bryobacteraceae bacterium]
MVTRRSFLGAAATAAAVAQPSKRVNVACIGMGRQGMAVIMDLLARPEVQVVAVCDCNRQSKDYAEYSPNALLNASRKLLGPGHENWGEDLSSPGSVMLTSTFKTSLGAAGRDPAKRLVEAYYAARGGKDRYRGCNAYNDFRELLAKERDVDAVYVATPDHWHAAISIAAMKAKKHVLCQKPMAHSVGEARRMADVARETGVATSVTVNNPASAATQQIKGWIAGGAIGAVREVHNWSSRPYWPQGVARPAGSPKAPEGLDWDLWVGPAAERAYHPSYLPFVWRGWCDFGCGSFGDMGCYSFAGIFEILGLEAPVAVEASASEPFPESYPKASMVHLEFAAKDGPVRLSWYDGGLKPPRPAGLRAEQEGLFKGQGEGIIYLGTRGMIVAGFNGQGARLYPEQGETAPAARDRGDPAVDRWLAACQGGEPGRARFEVQAPVTEAFLLGCLVQRYPGERMRWDAAAKRLDGPEAARRLIDPPWRGRWGV